MNTQTTQLAVPAHFQPEKVSTVWRVPYSQSCVFLQRLNPGEQAAIFAARHMGRSLLLKKGRAAAS